MYGYKFISYDDKVIECSGSQTFYDRDYRCISASDIKQDSWIKTKKGSRKICQIIKTLYQRYEFTAVHVTSLGGKFYLTDDTVTSYNPYI